MKIGVVGFGVVGRHMAEDIKRAGQDLAVYDIFGAGTREEINACEAAFVCVSTPQAADGSCDLTAIRDVFSWLNVPVAIIRSTVLPGTTLGFWNHADPDDPMAIVFSPEFIGEGVNAPYSAMRQPPFIIIGAIHQAASEKARNVFAHLYNSECEFIYTDTTSAELIKYFENIFLATKVTLFNEFYDICYALGGDWGQVVNGLTHDYRIGRSHTHVYPDKRGFDGRCLPKDTAALLALVGADTAPLLAAMIAANRRWHK